MSFRGRLGNPDLGAGWSRARKPPTLSRANPSKDDLASQVPVNHEILIYPEGMDGWVNG